MCNCYSDMSDTIPTLLAHITKLATEVGTLREKIKRVAPQEALERRLGTVERELLDVESAHALALQQRDDLDRAVGWLFRDALASHLHHDEIEFLHKQFLERVHGD